MKMCVLAGVATLAVSGVAAAGFTGTTVNQYSVDGFDVYDVYVTFESTDFILLNIYDSSSFFSSGYGWGNFNHNDILLGWNPSFANSPLDSFVTIGGGTGPASGNQTTGDPNWNSLMSGLEIPELAGWYNGNPQITQGQAQQVDLANGFSGAATLIGRFVLDGAGDGIFEFGMNFSLSYNGETGTLQDSGGFVIPSPGAIALLGLAGFVGRRRRA